MPRVEFRPTLDVLLPPHAALVARALLHYVNDLREQLDLDPIPEEQVVQTLQDLKLPATGG